MVGLCNSKNDIKKKEEKGNAFLFFKKKGFSKKMLEIGRQCAL